MFERRFEQPRLLPVHWSLLGKSSNRDLILQEENEKANRRRTKNGEISDDGNYSRPAGTATRTIFITR